ncbi:cytochrome P450 [Methylobacterium durans]|uniref:Cytochrome P450 n=1 Tax=Methylobacterium durans TaxID=2202825 RepID=A0A2U8W3T5_9HYPH|nr:cytochrome P450 [Methylobacterium durans]AWN40765.1 cytochrome P450 [Methylobacterium durans]
MAVVWKGAGRPVRGRTHEPPGPAGLPLLGNLLDLRRDPLAFFTACADRYGDVVSLHFGPKPALLLNDPAEIEPVLVGRHRAYPKPDFFWRQVTAVFGNGLLISQGSFWQRQRRLAAPAFAGPKLASYADTMVRLTEQMLDGWRTGEERDLHTDMMALTLKIAAETLFGAASAEDMTCMDAALADLRGEIASRFVRPFLIPDAVPLPGHLRYKRALRCVEGVVERIIREKRFFQDGDDLLTALMNARDETGEPMSDRQLRDEVVTFLLAGHETTALALTWTMYLLGRHPEADAAVAAEASAVLGDSTATDDDVARLRLAERTVMEGMRLYPPAWVIGREAGADCEIKGYRVRAGTPLYVSPWVLHRDPRFYDEPEAFRPARWKDDPVRRLPRFAYLPFGGGPRICIAHRFAMMEAVLILASIVRRFRLEPCSKQPIAPLASITLSPLGSVRNRVEARHNPLIRGGSL